MNFKVLVGTISASLLLASCTSPPNQRSIAFADISGYNSCTAERSVDWDRSLGWVDLQAIELRNEERTRWAPDLTGDDVAVYHEIRGRSRSNYALATRRGGAWTLRTAQSPDYSMPPPPPPPPEPGVEAPPPESYSCSGLHVKASGDAPQNLEAALEAFLGDGCRAYLPASIPAPLHFIDPEAQPCGYGTTSHITVETAFGVQHYSQTCPVPGSSLAELMQAFRSTTTPASARYYGASESFSVTLNNRPSRSSLASACQRRARTEGIDIDFSNPFEW